MDSNLCFGHFCEPRQDFALNAVFRILSSSSSHVEPRAEVGTQAKKHFAVCCGQNRKALQKPSSPNMFSSA